MKCSLCGRFTESKMPFSYPTDEGDIRIVLEKDRVLHSFPICETCANIFDAIIGLQLSERSQYEGN